MVFPSRNDGSNIYVYSRHHIYVLVQICQKPFEEIIVLKKASAEHTITIHRIYAPISILDDCGFSEVSAEAWQSFFIVDVLQLIGFSLLLLLAILFLTEKLKLNFTITFIVTATLIFLASPFMDKIDWISHLPAPIAAYFYSGSGSLFPIFRGQDM